MSLQILVPLDNIFQKFNSNVYFNHYDPNALEGYYIISLINKSINLFNKSGNLIRLISFENYKKNFIMNSNKTINLKSLTYHDNFIRSIPFKNKKIIYLYYGCSGKAMHRLPPLGWILKIAKTAFR